MDTICKCCGDTVAIPAIMLLSDTVDTIVVLSLWTLTIPSRTKCFEQSMKCVCLFRKAYLSRALLTALMAVLKALGSLNMSLGSCQLPLGSRPTTRMWVVGFSLSRYSRFWMILHKYVSINRQMSFDDADTQITQAAKV